MAEGLKNLKDTAAFQRFLCFKNRNMISSGRELLSNKSRFVGQL